jgi:hypothetical protein
MATLPEKIAMIRRRTNENATPPTSSSGDALPGTEVEELVSAPAQRRKR